MYIFCCYRFSFSYKEPPKIPSNREPQMIWIFWSPHLPGEICCCLPRWSPQITPDDGWPSRMIHGDGGLPLPPKAHRCNLCSSQYTLVHHSPQPPWTHHGSMGSQCPSWFHQGHSLQPPRSHFSQAELTITIIIIKSHHSQHRLISVTLSLPWLSWTDHSYPQPPWGHHSHPRLTTATLAHHSYPGLIIVTLGLPQPSGLTSHPQWPT